MGIGLRMGIECRYGIEMRSFLRVYCLFYVTMREVTRGWCGTSTESDARTHGRFSSYRKMVVKGRGN